MVSAREFIQVWNEAPSTEEAARRLGWTRQRTVNRAARLRGQGHALKKISRRKTPRTEIGRWLLKEGKSNRWLRDQLGADTTVAAVQHWVSGRKPIPQKHVDKVAQILAGEMTDD